MVIDWGLAKDLNDASTDEVDVLSESTRPYASAELTMLGEAIGTAPYMPPEQAQGQPVDERADVYAIGAHALSPLGWGHALR